MLLSRCLLVATVAAALSAAHADTIYVDDDNCPGPGSGTEADPFCSIQDAIDAAVDTDEIIVAPGTYFETINFLGKAVTLGSSEDGPEMTVIDGQQMGPVVTCESGEGPDTVLEGFVITGGSGAHADESDCCIAHGTPGCDDPECEYIVCSLFPDCCVDPWNSLCADVAAGICDLGCVRIGGGMLNVNSSPTVTDCMFTGNSVNRGGGMYNSNSGPTVTSCTFTGNTATRGGGMANLDSSPTVTNCTFDGNTADQDGGGMYNIESNPTVTDCTFSANTVVASPGMGGGMLNSSSSPAVTNCVFTGNSGFYGGGMSNHGSNPTVINCLFEYNTAGSLGGGMYSFSFTSEPTNPVVTGCVFMNNISSADGGGMHNASSASATVTNCVFVGNVADEGGGMNNQGNDSTIVNCFFINNHGNSDGGGMYNFIVSNPVVVNCVFEGNDAHRGGAVFNQWSNAALINCTFIANVGVVGGAMATHGLSRPVVSNCIFFSNPNGEIIDLIPASTTIVTYSNVQGGWPGPGNTDADPHFSDPANGDLRLLPDSPCIDAGDNTAVPENITTDLDGNPRFVDDPDTEDTGFGDPPIVDMGAFEFQIPCPWDLSGDGTVNVAELLIVIASWGPCAGCPADFNDDGFVNVVDLLALIANFGPCPGVPCLWDVNGDGVVDRPDLQQVLENLGPCDGCPEDVNGDGVVNGRDVAAVATHFGPCP
jgi:hypothetical protein